MQYAEPLVTQDNAVVRTVTGTFFRAVDPTYRAAALEGSRSAGRYSPPDVPTLYLSSSRDGVAAAMIAHSNGRTPNLEVLRFDVKADGIVDLRDHEALKSIGIDPADAAADWQQVVAGGGSPSSWKVRETLERSGAHGLIDPSRKQPHLWHLTLFTWNVEGSPSVREVQAR
ncbi:RES family NAD+ phosphorylase [Arthrobacter sp. ok362]|jgi:RES domain-containing protein|uniref:RES family NAD+ phosphorylase n=1 Tax=Arthrobacter sp. ok362 TaxID=1761745 RepID=UPI00087EC649|nr:RES domain-containing protein [Arthrobacter sp. ok362]SDL55510.1 RES domain-containing protein [Arthrobacter sp. ok362]